MSQNLVGGKCFEIFEKCQMQGESQLAGEPRDLEHAGDPGGGGGGGGRGRGGGGGARAGGGGGGAHLVAPTCEDTILTILNEESVLKALFQTKEYSLQASHQTSR